jgi:hypothetical protein
MLQAVVASTSLKTPFLMHAELEESALAPAAIRIEVAKLVAGNHMGDAERMLTDGLRRFPDSEDLLVMRALISESQLDWPAADITLQRLLSVQAGKAPAASWLHWVRVLRCMQQRERAREAMQMALNHHPHDSSLRAEAAALGVPPPPLSRQAA